MNTRYSASNGHDMGCTASRAGMVKVVEPFKHTIDEKGNECRNTTRPSEGGNTKYSLVNVRISSSEANPVKNGRGVLGQCNSWDHHFSGECGELGQKASGDKRRGCGICCRWKVSLSFWVREVCFNIMPPFVFLVSAIDITLC